MFVVCMIHTWSLLMLINCVSVYVHVIYMGIFLIFLKCLTQVQPKLDGEDSLILNILNPCFDASDGSQFNKVRAMQIVERIRSVRKESNTYVFLFGCCFPNHYVLNLRNATKLMVPKCDMQDSTNTMGAHPAKESLPGLLHFESESRGNLHFHQGAFTRPDWQPSSGDCHGIAVEDWDTSVILVYLIELENGQLRIFEPFVE